MNDTLLTNIPGLTIDKTIEILTNMYTSIIDKGLKMSTIPSVMLWGAPGVGKSQGIRQLARNIEKTTKKKVNITDVRLLLFNPIDLRGIPTANNEKTEAIWLRPQIFNMDASDDVINILFLDEINAAPTSVQAAAYQITLDHTVGEHKLPDNCLVIAAGNRTGDKSVAFKMPKALANRLLHFDIQTSFESWHKWAIENAVNSKVIGFLSFKRTKLMGFDPESNDVAFATPRSWELVSNLLNNVKDSEDNLTELIGGLVGMDTAMEFRTFLRNYNKLPNIKNIFAGKCDEIPTETDVLFALCSSLVSYARENSKDMKGIINSIKYIGKLPAEYAVLTLKDYLYINDELKGKLIKTKEYADMINKLGEIVNAAS